MSVWGDRVMKYLTGNFNSKCVSSFLIAGKSIGNILRELAFGRKKKKSAAPPLPTLEVPEEESPPPAAPKELKGMLKQAECRNFQKKTKFSVT